MPVSHVGLVVVDLPAATEFYLAALGPLGYRYIGTHDDMIGLGVDKADFFLRLPNPELLQDESIKFAPLHIAFRANHKREVKNFYIDAKAANGVGAGVPAYRRPDESIYNAAVYDPWGNTVEVVYYRTTASRPATGQGHPGSGTGPTPANAGGSGKPTGPQSASSEKFSSSREKLSSKEKLGMAANDSKLNVSGGGSKRSSRHGGGPNNRSSKDLNRSSATLNRSNTNLDSAGNRVASGNAKPAPPPPSASKHNRRNVIDTIVDIATGAAAACFAWKSGQPPRGQQQQQQPQRRNGGGTDYMQILNMVRGSRSSQNMRSNMYRGNNPRGSGFWSQGGGGGGGGGQGYDQYGGRSRQSLNRSRDDFDNSRTPGAGQGYDGGRSGPPPSPGYRGSRSTNDLFDGNGVRRRPPSRRSYFGF